MSDLSNLLTITYSFWATWANRTRSLICPQGLERFALSLRRNKRIFCFWKHFRKMYNLTKKNKKLIAHFLWLKEKMRDLLKKTSDSFIHSFVLSDLSKSLIFAHLPWGTWAICSQLLICPERAERIAHICSFARSNWAIERMSNEQMNEFPTLPKTKLCNLKSVE